ncbi:hypothetical protein BTM25_41240 [Actinomadura rubteroloni]|uniref:Streptomyces killer toxin-like beta/gamma crystallin domain-containing protein n=1 Tax=Actinomadura rubteroloni TaxID=1926885 RepID=A0A2P4UKD4_9ACTN|nr:hypothetical protein [Actinomadura rubteroloni]POM25476.1 hypothetical protein BTM25_41240 [Actinomadura rubteroloni]
MGLRLAATGAATAALAAVAVTAGQGAANATAGGYCGVYGSDTTPTITFTKQPPGCHDVNITWVSASDSYGGYYWNGSYWQLGSKGFRYLASGGHSPSEYNAVPLTNVNTGVKFYIDNSSSYIRTVHINY